MNLRDHISRPQRNETPFTFSQFLCIQSPKRVMYLKNRGYDMSPSLWVRLRTKLEGDVSTVLVEYKKPFILVRLTNEYKGKMRFEP